MSDERAPGDPDGPGPAGEIVTLVIDGGTAYVLLQLLGMTIDRFEGPELPRDVLIHAHDELAGQLGDPTYAERPRPPA